MADGALAERTSARGTTGHYVSGRPGWSSGSLAPVSALCDGCLGSATCWICSGSGAENTQARTGRCRSCAGTGRCAYCASVIVVDAPPDVRELVDDDRAQ